MSHCEAFDRYTLYDNSIQCHGIYKDIGHIFGMIGGIVSLSWSSVVSHILKYGVKARFCHLKKGKLKELIEKNEF